MKRAQSRKQIYRNRTKRSPCRGKTQKTCDKKYGCTLAKGRSGTYCRRMKNRSIKAISKASLLI